MATRNRGAVSQEMIDFALIDETVNEWMADASPETSNQEPIAPPEGVTKEGAKSHSRVLDRSVQSRAGLMERFKQLSGRAPLRNVPIPALSAVPSEPLTGDEKRRLDRVLCRVTDLGQIPTSVVRTLLSIQKPGEPLSWRTVAHHDVSLAHVLQRSAAEVYGFRSVLICQMSTLVLADLLTIRVPSHLWRPMFECGLVPVVEHGYNPDPNGRIVCVSPDPTGRPVRSFLEQIKSFRPELAYADEGHVRSVMTLVAQNVPVIGAEVATLSPAIRSIHHSGSESRAA